MSEEVLTSEEDGILVVTINRPEAKNAMTKAAAEGIAGVAADKETSLVIVGGQAVKLRRCRTNRVRLRAKQGEVCCEG